MDLTWKSASRLALLVLLLVIVTHLKGPSLWAQTQLLFDYDLGFQRRTLVGEIVSWIFPNGLTHDQIHAVAFFLSLSMILTVTGLLWSRYQNAVSGPALILMYVSSIGTAAVIGATGYLDMALYVLVVGILLSPTSTFGLSIRIVFVTLGMLIHENFLPYFAGIVFLDSCIRNENQTIVTRVLRSALLPLWGVVLGVVLFGFGVQPFENIWPLIENAKAKAVDFEIRAAALEPLVAFPEGKQASYDTVWGSEQYIWRLTAFGLTGGVALVLSLFPVFQATANRDLLDRLLVIAAIVAPITLLFVAFDISRFVAIAILNVFLVSAILVKSWDGFDARLKEAITPIIFVTLLALGGQTALRDFNSGGWESDVFPYSLLMQTDWSEHRQPISD